MSDPSQFSASTKGDRRRSVRYPAGGVSGCLPGSKALEIVDVSGAGVAAATGERLQMNHTYNVKIQYRHKQLDIGARVVWCRLTETRKTAQGEFAPWYQAGLAFPHQLGSVGRELLATMKNMWITTLPTHTLGIAEFRPLGGSSFSRLKGEIQVRKISQKGLAGLISVEPEPLTQIDLDIPLGIELEHAEKQGSHLIAQGRVTGRAELTEEGRFNVGIEFRRVSMKSRKALSDFMDERMSQRGYPRVPGTGI